MGYFLASFSTYIGDGESLARYVEDNVMNSRFIVSFIRARLPEVIQDFAVVGSSHRRGD